MFSFKSLVLKFGVMLIFLLGLTFRVYGGGDTTCPSGHFPSRLTAGGQGRVLPSQTFVEIHPDPFGGSAIGKMPSNTRFQVSLNNADPQCSREMLWVYIETRDGLHGWVAEVVNEAYLLEPINTTAPLPAPLPDVAPQTFGPGTVDYNGVHFNVDPALATQIDAQFVGVSTQRLYEPAHLRFDLTPTEPGQVPFMSIRIISAQDISNSYPGTIADLRDRLNGVPGAEVPSDLIWVFSDAVALAAPHEGVIPLGNGKAHWGLRYTWHDALAPSNLLVNSVFGLTDDEQYYIEATFATYYKDLSLYTLPAIDQEASDFDTSLEAFHQNIQDTIASASDSDFTPHPSQIHALLSSLVVDPGTLKEVIAEAEVIAAIVGTSGVDEETVVSTPETATPTRTSEAVTQNACEYTSALDYIDEEMHPSWNGSAFEMNGPGTTVQVDALQALNLGEADFSFHTRFKLDANDVYGSVIFDKRFEYETVQGITLALVYDNQLVLQLADGLSMGKAYQGSWTNYVSDTALRADQWHTVTVTVDRDDRNGGKLYLNGQLDLVFNPTVHSGSLNSDVPLMLGQRSSSDSGHFYGEISNLEFFSCVLAEQDILRLFAGENISTSTFSVSQSDMQATYDAMSTQTPRLTPTPSPTPTLIGMPTPFPVYCPGSPPSRIEVGNRARVTISKAGEVREDLRVRDMPAGDRIGAMAEGTRFNILGGYECAEDRTWWFMQTLDGSLTGWVTEGTGPDDYYIEPIDN